MASLTDLFDDDAERLRGVETWEDLALVGRNNLDRLIELLRDRANAALAEDRLDDARARSCLISELKALREKTSFDRPMLPRIRVELFRVGSPLALFLGDSPGALAPGWVTAAVTSVAKSFRPEWKTARGNSGYFWEVTACAERDLFEGIRSVRFSTTEPRALPMADLETLGSVDAHFRRIFAANSWRDWNPLWCIDRGVTIDAEKIDFDRWLRAR